MLRQSNIPPPARRAQTRSNTASSRTRPTALRLHDRSATGNGGRDAAAIVNRLYGTSRRSPNERPSERDHVSHPELVEVIALPGAKPLVVKRARAALARGTAVLVVPADASTPRQMRRLAVAYDGSRCADAALTTARAVAEIAPDLEQFDIVFVDDPALVEGDAVDAVVASRRHDVIGWWLKSTIGESPFPANPLRLSGDPVERLAEFSHHVDLLVVGTRERGSLRRAISPGVAAGLIGKLQSTLLIVPPSALRAPGVDPGAIRPGRDLRANPVPGGS